MILWTLLKKDARIVVRSRLLLVVLLMYPLVLAAILGYAFSEPKEKFPIALVNHDVDADGFANVAVIGDPFAGAGGGARGISSEELALGLSNLTDVVVVDTDAEARRLLLTGQVLAVVVVPDGFAQQVVTFGNGSARLEVIVDLSDAVRATIMETHVRGVIQRFQEFIVEEKVRIVVAALEESLQTDLEPEHFVYPGFEATIQALQALRGDPGLTDAQRADIDLAIEFLQALRLGVVNAVDVVRSVAQPVVVDLEQERSGSLFTRDLIVPAALGLSVFWTGSLATAALVVYERESVVFIRLGVSPAGRTTILASKVLLTTFIVFVQAVVILGAAVAAFGTRVDNLGLSLLLILLSALASVGIGLVLSGLTRDVSGAVLLSVLVTFPMLFMAGLFYPVDFMPRGAQLLAQAFPLTYTVAGLRGSMLRGFLFADAGTHLLALALFALAFGVVGILLGRRLETRA